MKILELYEFVTKTDISKSKPVGQRRRIAVLGLVSEVGSILSALKKGSLSGHSDLKSKLVSGMLKEEIGDAIWYTIMLANLIDDPVAENIFNSDISKLYSQLTGKAERQKKVQKTLGKTKISKFKQQSKTYLNKDKPTLNDYQSVAFLTARTHGSELSDVCAAVLQQLSAQIIREFLPVSELDINVDIVQRETVDTLGKIIWHLSALATVYKLELADICELSIQKSVFRNIEGTISKRHDRTFSKAARFPEQFEIKFTAKGTHKTIMTWEKANGESIQLGSELTDNNHGQDGYRFHDVMHIAFAVHLGWSPNLRKFMDLKRTENPKVDEVEDGGRAKILEEMVILDIHTHAEKLQNYLSDGEKKSTESPYNFEGSLGFEFVRNLHNLTEGYEVFSNPVQDWEAAIRDGYKNFHLLKDNNGGTIIGDMKLRKLTYRMPSK